MPHCHPIILRNRYTPPFHRAIPRPRGKQPISHPAHSPTTLPTTIPGPRGTSPNNYTTTWSENPHDHAWHPSQSALKKERTYLPTPTPHGHSHLPQQPTTRAKAKSASRAPLSTPMANGRRSTAETEASSSNSQNLLTMKVNTTLNMNTKLLLLLLMTHISPTQLPLPIHLMITTPMTQSTSTPMFNPCWPRPTPRQWASAGILLARWTTCSGGSKALFPSEMGRAKAISNPSGKSYESSSAGGLGTESLQWI